MHEIWLLTWWTGETCAGDMQVPGTALPLCNFGPLTCLSQYQHVSAFLSMQRHWSVQLQSADPRPYSLPSRSRAHQPGQTWHKTEDEHHTTQAWFGSSCFCSKIKPIFAFDQNSSFRLQIM